MAAPQVLTDWYTAKVNSQPTGTGLLAGNSTVANNATVPTVDAATYKPTLLGDPTKWNVDSNQTTQGQLTGILNSNSPLMQQAATQGQQQAASRGLLNSNLAVGAAQGAMIERATPIAQSDADVYSKSAGYNADTANTFAKTNADISNTASSFGAQAINRANEFNTTNQVSDIQQTKANEFNAAENAKQNQFTASQTDVQNKFTAEQTAVKNKFDAEQSLFQKNAEASLAQINNDASLDRQTQQAATSLYSDYLKSRDSIITNVGMTPDTKQFYMDELNKNLANGMTIMSSVGKIPDIGSLLSYEEVEKTPGQLQQEKLDTEAQTRADQLAADAKQAELTKAKNTQQQIAYQNIIKNGSKAKATTKDVEQGFATYDQATGNPVYTAEFVKQQITTNANARKAKKQAPTKADITNGFATQQGKKIVWK